MSDILSPENPELILRLRHMFRDFFSKAERNRRWSLDDDIPWARANTAMDPAVIAIVESFCAVELYLPDYVAKALPLARTNRGWAWFHVNWGYEESKHSMALEDWLLHSKARSEEQIIDMCATLFQVEWNLPEDSASGMVIYAMTQELATWVSYVRLRRHVQSIGDPALEEVLKLISIDERAHHTHYKKLVKIFLELDREGTLEQMRRVLHNFAMPALYMMGDTQQRQAQIRDLKVFDEEIFFNEVYYPILNDVGVTRAELRGRRPKKSEAASTQ